MKNSQKKGAAKAATRKKATGAPVRQKRAAKLVAPAAAEAVKKPPVPKEKKVFIALIALLCVFAISFLTLGSLYLVGSGAGVAYGSLYENGSLKKYVSFGKNDFTGKKIDLSGAYLAPYTLADMDDYLKELLLSKRTEVSLGVKTGVIGYGDDVECYLLSAYTVDENGAYTPVLANGFAAANYSAAYLTVGAGSSIFGAPLDEAIIALGIAPIETYRAIRLDGALSGGEVIAVSYQAVKPQSYDPAKPEEAKWSTEVTASTKISDSQLGQARMDLADVLANGTDNQKILANAIVNNCKELEEPFEFVLENYDSNGDKVTEEAVKYTATVHFVAEEKTVDVLFDIPADHFKETDGATKEYLALNGKKLALRMIFSTMNDYEVPAPTAAFLKGLDESFKTDATADADVLSAFKAYSLEKLNAQREKSVRASYYAEVYANLVSALYPSAFGAKDASTVDAAYPEGAYAEAYTRAYTEVSNSYYSSGASASMQLYDYVLYYVYNATGSQYEDANQALSAVAQQYVAYDLFMYYVFDLAGLHVKDELLKEKYAEHIASLIASSDEGDGKTEYNEAYFVETLGKDALYTEARRQAVYELVGEYLLEHNEITYGG